MSATIRGQLRPSVVRPRAPTAAPRAARRSIVVRADISASSALAISQQAIAYAVAVAGENLYMRSMNREGAPGRPALPLTVAGAGSAVASAVLVSSGVGPLASVGLAVGFLGAAVTMVVSGKRAVEVQGDPFAWPGPRAWPVFTAIASFAAASAFLQAFVYGGGQ